MTVQEGIDMLLLYPRDAELGVEFVHDNAGKQERIMGPVRSARRSNHVDPATGRYAVVLSTSALHPIMGNPEMKPAKPKLKSV
jgi:hypothetical protein